MQYDSVAYDQVKTALSELQAEAEEQTNDNARFRALRLVGSSASASDSDNLVFSHWIISDGVGVNGIGRNGLKRSDSSNSDSVELMTPLTTPIFDFH